MKQVQSAGENNTHSPEANSFAAIGAGKWSTKQNLCAEGGNAFIANGLDSSIPWLQESLLCVRKGNVLFSALRCQLLSLLAFRLLLCCFSFFPSDFGLSLESWLDSLSHKKRRGKDPFFFHFRTSKDDAKRFFAPKEREKIRTDTRPNMELSALQRGALNKWEGGNL